MLRIMQDENKFINIGIASHITAASEGGPRYDQSLSQEDRKSINNGIFLCSNCAGMVDKNNGVDFSVETLQKWKANHELWVLENLNKSNSSNHEGVVFNVTSHDQKGGITAGLVNIGSRQRKLKAGLETQLIQLFPDKDKPITIKCLLGNPESINYAQQIHDFLISQGYKIDGFLQVIPKAQERGQFVDPDKRIIIIGN